MERIRNDPNYKPGDEKCLVLSETKIYDNHGRVIGTEYVYLTPSIVNGKIDYVNGQVQYKGQNANDYPKKTTYDPSVITDAEFNAMTKNAANNVWSDGVSINHFMNKYPNPKSKVVQYFDTNTDLKYEVYLNFDIQTNMPYIGTVYLAK